jgi:CysZ protein
MISDVTIGLQALARGTRLLNQPGVRIYVIIPLCINLLLFGALIWYGYSLFYPFVEWMMSFVPGFLDFLEWFIWLFFGSLAAITVFFSFTPVANIVAAPFNALMSEKIEIYLTGKALSSNVSFGKMAIDAIASQLRKLVYILLWALGLFLISLIPVVNLIAPVLWVIFGRGIALGFGGGIMVLTSIPIINFITMPVAVAGATLLWVEQFQPNQAD